MHRIAFLLGSIALGSGLAAQETAPCAATIQELRRLTGSPAFPLHWEEISMDDGKPLVISILERNGALALEFLKTGEGMWAEGNGLICADGAELELRLSRDRLRLGPAANWAIRLALADGATFILRREAPGRLHIAAQGWSGHFVPKPVAD